MISPSLSSSSPSLSHSSICIAQLVSFSSPFLFSLSFGCKFTCAFSFTFCCSPLSPIIFGFCYYTSAGVPLQYHLVFIHGNLPAVRWKQK
ncbi:hypothetical protein L873DRAFT_1417017 [Choiromyces venosus 120613-1]|uniref:Uncharacterized protein n=1 Tax=Choiromyces venosus 120613-1 TaxID=1336337 RepID=A0A3N4JL79_9PEZI|nr:hypothetical protein L873DRAFT_1417017 [Choiromyces venosus 120613-1]